MVLYRDRRVNLRREGKVIKKKIHRLQLLEGKIQDKVKNY